MRNHALEEQLVAALIPILSDGFNRALGSLEEAGALDLTKLRKKYTGVGSEYYDVVTSALQATANYARPMLRQIADSQGEP